MSNPQAHRSEAVGRSLLFRQAVTSALRARAKRLPLAPASLPGLLTALENGFAAATDEPEAKDALIEIRQCLFEAGGRESESRAIWHEAVATAMYAARLAQIRQSCVAAAALGGLLHRAGEALALKTLARAEAENRARLDAASRRDVCSEHSQDLAERLVREWSLPPEVGTCILGWSRFGEFAGVSHEGAAVYFGRMLAIELLQSDFCVPGALDAAAAELGLPAQSLERIRAEGDRVRELIRALE
jgi:hypothetical protein